MPQAVLRKAASAPLRNSYPSTDAQGLHKQVAAWNLLHECRKASAWRSITHAWRALLFPHHGIAIKNSDSSAYIVLKATRFVLRARCANACMMGAYLQVLSDAQPLGEMMLALVAPVWTAATKDTEGLKFAPLRRIGRSTAPICYPT